MRAWQVQGAGEPEAVLHEVEVDPPEPGPGQVRVRVTAAGIGLPDVLMCRGSYPLTPPLPFTPGQEATGVVTAVGDGVGLAVGDRVMAVTMFWQGSGSFAEECLLDASSTFAAPVGLSDAESAGFWIPNMTGWIGLVDRGGIAEGDHLVVLGAAGGSGIAAVQLGHALGARVIAVVGGVEKAAYCRALGADVTIDHRSAGPLADAIREATGGRGADIVYDPVGGETAEAAARALTRDGRLLAVGFASGRWPSIATHDLVTSNTSMVGVFAGGYSREELDAIHARLSGLVADGRLRSAVTNHVEWSDLPQALQRMAGRDVIGKQVLLPLTADFDLDADEIVDAAVEIFEEKGLDAVSMRSVSSRLGVSPVPLYSRVGNKDALVDAIADRLLTDLAPDPSEDEPWPAYAMRWAHAVRDGTRRARDSRLILWPGRDAYVEASRPLIDVLRRNGFEPDAAVQACRLLTWAIVGFSAVESGARPPTRRRRTRPGGDPGGVDPAEADALFDLHVRYVVEGIEREASA